MTTRKRKSPKGRRTAKEQGLPSRILAGAGSAVARGITRNPGVTLGAGVFIVAFSFVAANALWYQPGGHPSPFLATRDARDPNAIAGYRSQRRPEPADVTTFRIERAPAGEPVSIPQVAERPASQPMPQPATQPVQTADGGDDIRSIIAGEPADGTSPMPEAATAQADRALVAGIQRELANRGLYQGTDDGLMGPRTEAAILFFEQSSGLPQRGLATQELLAALQMSAGARMPAAAPSGLPQVAASPAQNAVAPLPTPVPRQAPRAEPQRNQQARPVTVASRTNTPAAQPVRAPAQNRAAENAAIRGEDPITAAIRAAERQPSMTPPAEIPGQTRQQASRRADPVPASQLVLQIQKGLSNIAYTDVEVDGVAGTQTKAAIKRFQKHYRLPETGEPDELVLKKLKAIGAL